MTYRPAQDRHLWAVYQGLRYINRYERYMGKLPNTDSLTMNNLNLL